MSLKPHSISGWFLDYFYHRQAIPYFVYIRVYLFATPLLWKQFWLCHQVMVPMVQSNFPSSYIRSLRRTSHIFSTGFTTCMCIHDIDCITCDDLIDMF